MRFELDEILIDEIVFCMENQDSDFLFDAQERKVIDLFNEDDNDIDSNDERYINLPEWSSQDGYRLMEKFASSLKNPVIRQELSDALNRNKGVFRSFKNVLDQYPETGKQWFKFKDNEMKSEVISWYNALREEWGLEPVGSEPEDTSSLVFEDFILRDGKKSDFEKTETLHKICVEDSEYKSFFFETSFRNNKNFPGDYSFVAESASGDFCGYINTFQDNSFLHISSLEVKPEYRGMGLGRALLVKIIEKAGEKKLHVTIDLPSDMEYFTRTLRLEEFIPCVQRFVRISGK